VLTLTYFVPHRFKNYPTLLYPPFLFIIQAQLIEANVSIQGKQGGENDPYKTIQRSRHRGNLEKFVLGFGQIF